MKVVAISEMFETVYGRLVTRDAEYYGHVPRHEAIDHRGGVHIKYWASKDADRHNGARPWMGSDSLKAITEFVHPVDVVRFDELTD